MSTTSVVPEALPELDEPYSVSEQQLKQFWRDGHIRLNGVCNADEIAAYREVIREAAYANFGDMPDMAERDAYGKAFMQTLNLRYRHAGVKRFVLSKRFSSIAAQLLQRDRVRIYHEQALFKEPGGAHTPWHQDQYYWPLATDRALGMWMPLSDVSLEMGPIRFASGSHKEGFVGQHAISDDSQAVFDELVAKRGYPNWQQAMSAGDATFHLGWTIHGASPNVGTGMREAMIITYFPDGTRVDELSNPSREGDAKHFLGGRAPGELADSDMNTLVYP